jgi:hypothetical protein
MDAGLRHVWPPPSRDSEKLLEPLEVSRELFERHLELIKRELESS